MQDGNETGLVPLAPGQAPDGKEMELRTAGLEADRPAQIPRF
jgi:hypothetical protein